MPNAGHSLTLFDFFSRPRRGLQGLRPKTQKKPGRRPPPGPGAGWADADPRGRAGRGDRLRVPI